ncbi:MAG TPA: lipid-A-disaccharide synthase [Prolixibacteraceae bacterium]|jgi:lipid-A-disaccharide synthase
MKYFIIAGEASGDLHASHLMRELKNGDNDSSFTFFGGELMAQEGGTLLKHYREMAFMGLLPVIFNLHKIKRNFILAEKKLLEFKPDVLILVDYPGFNLRMAEFAKANGIKVFYYISPKIWAWKTKRVHKVKKFVDEMFTIFPFESDFYKKYDYKVRFVGNPTIDELAHRPNQQETFAEFIAKNKLKDKPVIALLAGSRRHEIQRILPVLANVSIRFPEYQFVIAGAPSQSQLLYDEVLGKTTIPVVFGQTYELLQQSTAALVASGTATLETAYINIPQVVCYRIEAGRLGTWVKDQLIKIPFISLVNLIAGREIVRELFQQYCTPDTVSNELNKILTDSAYREAMLAGYAEVLDDLGGPGCAERAASLMIELLNRK